jgi:biopolymer transport protein ExbD
VVQVSIDANGGMRWNGEALPNREALQTRMAWASQLPTPPEIHIQGDGSTPYAFVAAVLTTAQQSGLQKVGVVGLEALAAPKAAIAP